jgi:hypothetical protein
MQQARLSKYRVQMLGFALPHDYQLLHLLNCNFLFEVPYALCANLQRQIQRREKCGNNLTIFS